MADSRRLALHRTKISIAAIPDMTATDLPKGAGIKPVTMTDADCVVVGGGIVGLATAYALQRGGRRDVLVLDKESGPGAHQSGHNSGVIHSGLYYAPGSYKARLCVAGAAAMRAFCTDHGIPHRISGKLVVAADDGELRGLAELERRGLANGVAGLRRVGASDIKAIEPHARGVAGLHVTTTGVTDYLAVCRVLVDQIVARGGDVRWGQEVASVKPLGETGQVTIRGGASITGRRVIVCAGINSDRLAPDRREVRIVPFRGGYIDLTSEGAALVGSMIYPVPDRRFPFLGVHFTRHIDDTVSVGPNAILHLSRERHRRYAFDGDDAFDILRFAGVWRLATKYWRPGTREMLLDLSRALYLRQLRRYVPDLEKGHLAAGAHLGIRAQAVDRTGTLLDDFLITRAGPIMHVLNAPSPAATASLAIGEHLASLASAG
jgi:L-2-hydroxyglutarate oxidase LhgO